MKRPCREIGTTWECEKFSDKGTESKEEHGMGELFNYRFQLSEIMSE